MAVTINIQEHLLSDQLLDTTGLLLQMYPHLQNNEDIVLTSTGEGHSFEINGLYAFLDKICDTLNFPKNKIHLETWNLLEKHNEYTIIIKNEIFDIKYFADIPDITTPAAPNVGVFLGRPDYPRLLFHSKVKDLSWRDRLIYTFHLDLNIEPWPMAMSEFVMRGGSYSDVEATTPHSDINETIIRPIVPPQNIVGLKPVYNDIALEIVFETLHQSGFFVTEKTLRPIYYGRPFIVVGPLNFEKNLEKLGFNLDFKFPDNLRNVESSNRVRPVIDIINRWFLNIDVAQWFDSIRPTLLHNQAVLKNYVINNGLIDLTVINKLN